MTGLAGPDMPTLTRVEGRAALGTCNHLEATLASAGHRSLLSPAGDSTEAILCVWEESEVPAVLG